MLERKHELVAWDGGRAAGMPDLDSTWTTTSAMSCFGDFHRLSPATLARGLRGSALRMIR